MLKKMLVLWGLAFVSSITFANTTVWTAGSNYKGTVTVPIENGGYVAWKCNGEVCTLTGPYGRDLSLESCQFLVSKIGPITFYGNSEKKLWNKNQTLLAKCNQAAR